MWVRQTGFPFASMITVRVAVTFEMIFLINSLRLISQGYEWEWSGLCITQWLICWYAEPLVIGLVTSSCSPDSQCTLRSTSLVVLYINLYLKGALKQQCRPLFACLFSDGKDGLAGGTMMQSGWLLLQPYRLHCILFTSSSPSESQGQNRNKIPLKIWLKASK